MSKLPVQWRVECLSWANMGGWGWSAWITGLHPSRGPWHHHLVLYNDTMKQVAKDRYGRRLWMGRPLGKSKEHIACRYVWGPIPDRSPSCLVAALRSQHPSYQPPHTPHLITTTLIIPTHTPHLITTTLLPPPSSYHPRHQTPYHHNLTTTTYTITLE